MRAPTTFVTWVVATALVIGAASGCRFWKRGEKPAEEATPVATAPQPTAPPVGKPGVEALPTEEAPPSVLPGEEAGKAPGEEVTPLEKPEEKVPAAGPTPGKKLGEEAVTPGAEKPEGAVATAPKKAPAKAAASKKPAAKPKPKVTTRRPSPAAESARRSLGLAHWPTSWTPRTVVRTAKPRSPATPKAPSKPKPPTKPTTPTSTVKPGSAKPAEGTAPAGVPATGHQH